MEFGTFFGVPAHPLFVHIPVVLTPLAALTAFLMINRRWRTAYLWVTVALAGVATLGAQLSVGAGEELEESVEESRALEAHASLGEGARTFIAIFFAITLALYLYEFFKRRRSQGATARTPERLIAVMVAAMLLSGSLATVWVVRAGHQGAKITWDDEGSEEENE